MVFLCYWIFYVYVGSILNCVLIYFWLLKMVKILGVVNKIIIVMWNVYNMVFYLRINVLFIKWIRMKKINVIVIVKFFLEGNLFDLLLNNNSLKKI